jgi:probable F420-dependent oxidoreductase
MGSDRRGDPMSVGLVVPMAGGRFSRDLLRRFSCKVEDLGFDSLWTWERLIYPVQSRTRYGGSSITYRQSTTLPDQQKSVMAPTEVMAAIAAWTDRVRIGSSVVIMGVHNPVQLAKRLATIDQLSSGRLLAGLGLGWSEDEHVVAGVDYHTRGRRSEEFLDVLLACWGDDPVEHHGEFFEIPSSFIGPKPIQQPHPPLLLGLWSKAGLARTARRADGWVSGGGLGVDKAQEAVGWMNSLRRPDQSRLTVHHRIPLQTPVPSGPDLTLGQVVTAAEAARGAGFDEIVIDPTYASGFQSPEAWLAFPELMRPLLAIAQSPS